MKTSLLQSPRPWCAVLLALALLFGGCGPERPRLPPEAFAHPTNPRPAQSGAERSYTLHVGDQVDFKFFYNPELNDIATVRPDGMVSLQLIGEVRAEGLTPQSLREAVAELYKGTLKHPEVAVLVRKYAPEKIYVGGQVKTPGALPLEGPTTALQAIINAGGFNFGASRESVLVLTRDAKNNYGYRILDLQSHLDLTSNQDMPLQPNDVIFVPQTKVNEVAQYFKENINEILPMWRNSGFSFPFFYNLNPQSTIQYKTTN